MRREIIRGLKRWAPTAYGLRVLRLLEQCRVDLWPLREIAAINRGYVEIEPGCHRIYSKTLPRLCAGKATFLDVGANNGWFAKTVFRFCGHNARVISFEPLKSALPALSALRDRYPGHVAMEGAVGAAKGEAEITEYGTHGLSSLKPLSGAYAYFADTTVVNRYKVSVTTIDDFLAAHPISGPIILKIDTQGSEREVLLGAEKALGSGAITAVIVEMMTVEKYAGAALYTDLMDILHRHGFRLFDMHPAFHEPDGRLSEFDAIFVGPTAA